MRGRLGLILITLACCSRAYFASRWIDTQQRAKDSLLSGGAPSLSLASVVVVTSVWLLVFCVASVATGPRSARQNEVSRRQQHRL